MKKQQILIKHKELNDKTGNAAIEMLIVIQEDAAQNLVLSQQMKAADLRRLQSDTAADLLEENLVEMLRLAAISASEVHSFAERECQRNVYQQELEDTLSWASGAYSVASVPLEVNVQCLYEAMIGERELTATKLSKRQESAARELQERQEKTAVALKTQDAESAERLKDKNNSKTSVLLEKQAIETMANRPAV